MADKLLWKQNKNSAQLLDKKKKKKDRADWLRDLSKGNQVLEQILDRRGQGGSLETLLELDLNLRTMFTVLSLWGLIHDSIHSKSWNVIEPSHKITGKGAQNWCGPVSTWADFTTSKLLWHSLEDSALEVKMNQSITTLHYF